MPRLPTLDDLGSRPVPISRRQIATNPRAGAVGGALEGLGQSMAGVGQQMLEQQDKLNYAAAKSSILKADVAARQELERDPDYETWGTRYAERMQAAKDEAAKAIKSSSQRALFGSDADLDIARGGAELSKLANGRRRSARVATLNQSLADLQDVGQDATDDATREAVIGQALGMIKAGVEGGDIDAVAAGELGRKWTENYVLQQVEARKARGDLEGAQAFFEANRERIDAGTEIRLNQQIRDAVENRENLMIAEDKVHGVGAVTVSPAEAPTMSKMIAITAKSESNNRERDAAGRLVTSHAGAQGRMQVMPATARDPGHGIRPWDGKSDADRSRVGEELLAALVKKYGGDVAKAWGAYNWGEARVDKAVARHGENWLSHAPAETRNYVEKNVKALGGTTQSPARRDLNEIFASIDEDAAKRGWTPERREAIKAQAAKLVGRDEELLRRQQDDAFETALAKADTMGANFTNVSQLGDAFYKASPADQHRLRGMADANMKASIKEPPANGDVIRSLHVMEIRDPAKFAGLDIRQYRPFMTAGEFDDLATSQARAKADAGKGWNPRSGIQGAMTWGEKFGGVDLKNDEDRYRVYRYMETRAREWSTANGGKAPSENEYQSFFREATQQRQFTQSFLGIPMPGTTGRAYETVSAPYRAMITRQFRAVKGRAPTEAEIEDLFNRMGEELK